jgi:hypothetical protein
MAGSRRGTGLLVTGALLSALNAAVHFVLPVIYPWDALVDGLYAPLRWALYASMFFFGLLLLLASILTLLLARVGDAPPRYLAAVAGGMAVFWALATAYQLMVPFPLPVAAWALPAFCGLTALLHAAGLWLRLAEPVRRAQLAWGGG